MTDERDWNWKIGDFGYVVHGSSYYKAGSIIKVTRVTDSGNPLFGDEGCVCYSKAKGSKREVLRCVRPGEVIPEDTKCGFVRSDGKLRLYTQSYSAQLSAGHDGFIVLMDPPAPEMTAEERRRTKTLKRINRLKAEVAELERTVKE